jgi:hypothetical protein
MEKRAGTSLFVLLLVAGACILLFRPELWFIVGSLVSGVIVYWCWRAMLANRPRLGAAAAVTSVLVFLLAAVPIFTLSLPTLVVTGMSLAGVGLYASILLTRFAKRKAGT